METRSESQDPRLEKRPHYIYIYKEGTKRGGVKISFLGVKMVGSFNLQKPQKHQK